MKITRRRFLDALAQDLRLSVRSLSRDRWVTLVTIVSLAVGLGMNVAVFSVVKTVLLRPFPFADQKRLVIIWERDPSRDSYLHEVSYPNFLDWRSQSESFAEMAAMGSTFWGRHRFVGEDEPFSGAHRAVSYSFFDTLGVPAALGRTFLPEDDAAGAPPVMVVSHRFWRAELASDPDVVGKSLTLIDGGPVTVVGVMPPEFDYPRGTDVWTPLGAHLARIFERNDSTPAEQRGLGVLFVIARLRPDVSIETASSELTGIVQRLRAEQSSVSSPGRGARVQPLVDELLGQARPALMALSGAVVLVWLLVCTNVAALLLVRVASRGRQYAIKLALGAGRLRLVRQLVTEVGLVTLLGAGLGWILASSGIRLLVHLSSAEVPRIEGAALDPGTLSFFAVTVIATVGLVAMAPATVCGSRDGGASLGNAGLRSTDSRRGTKLRQWLVVTQVALALVLLVGTALMARSFVNLQQADLGYEPRNVLTFNVALPNSSYPSHQSRRALYRELLGRVNAMPGVVAAAAMSNRPFLHGQVGVDWTFFVEGQAPEERMNNPRAIGMVVSTDYFRTMRIGLLTGRGFTEHDDASAERVIVVSESLARHAWPGQDPIGKKLCCGRAESGDGRWLTVVGVVENARYRDVYAPRLDIYEHYLQGWSQLPSFVVRARSDPLESAGAIREQVRALDPRLSLEGITTMDEVVSRVFTPWRISTAAFTLFAIVAVGLAGLGLFGVLAFSVHLRTREIGIRVTFGASSQRIAGLVAAQAMRLMAVGAVLGSAGGFLVTGVLESLLYGATATHPTTYAAAVAVLVLAAGIATYLPVRQATKVDPWASLRHE